MGDPVLLSIRDGAAVLTLNRGAEGNRIDLEMCAALESAAQQIAGTAGLRALLIRAEGRMFSVGGSVDEFTAMGNIPAYLATILPMGHRAIRILANLPCPVISALQGPVAGAGVALALCADFVLAGQAMVLRAGYPALGLSSDFGASWFLTRLAGPRRASDILMSNRAVGAAECLSMGLVSSVHPDEALEGEARKLLASLAAAPTHALARMKSLVGHAVDNDLPDHLAMEARLMIETGGTEDAAEGVAAFLARRKPVFQGR